MQRWTKWLHTTKAITRISVDLFHSKRPLDYPSRHMYEAHIHITGHPTKQPDSQSFLLLLKWVVILFLLFLMFFFSPPFVFQPNPRVLKTVLENIPRRLQPSFKKREKKRKKKEGMLVVVILLWKVTEIRTSGMNLTKLGAQWMLFLFFSFWGIFVCSWWCSLESTAAILSGLHTSSSTPAQCRKAKQLPFSIHGNWRCCKTLLGDWFCDLFSLCKEPC